MRYFKRLQLLLCKEFAIQWQLLLIISFQQPNRGYTMVGLAANVITVNFDLA
jgi:hypothetical protein